MVVSHKILVALQYTTKRPLALAEPEMAKPAAKSAAETEREILLNFIINTPYWIEWYESYVKKANNTVMKLTLFKIQVKK